MMQGIEILFRVLMCGIAGLAVNAFYTTRSFIPALHTPYRDKYSDRSA